MSEHKSHTSSTVAGANYYDFIIEKGIFFIIIFTPFAKASVDRWATSIMKIAYISLKGMPFPGGIEKYTEEVGSRLVERGHEIVVYTMRHYGTVAGDVAKEAKRHVLENHSWDLIAKRFETLYEDLVRGG